MAIAGLFCCCAGDDEPQAPATRHELRVSMSPRQFEDLTTRTVTRADATVSDPFELYDYSTNLSKIDQIQAYLTATEVKDGQSKHTVVAAPFTYQHTDDNWLSRVPLVDGTYYFYGFMPSEGVGSSVNVAPYNGDYQNGAVLTLNDLDAVSPEDICIIVGAEGYGSGTKTAPAADMTTRLGQFQYNTTDGDKLFLLADHLYAGLEFRLKLSTAYSKLRKIKINKISLTPDTGDGNVVETVTARVTIVSNTELKNPIVPISTGGGNYTGGSVTFTNTSTGSNPKPAVLYNGEGLWLSDTDQPFLACFCPATNTKFVLRTEYDVYGRDGKDNLIRQNQTAENHIKLQYDLKSGQKHIINITVNPTYLYVLSDPDLDNPTFTVN